MRLGPSSGQLLLHTRRQGVASKVGHDLTIVVTDWSAEVDLPNDNPADATVRAEIQMASLKVLEGTGGVKPLTDRDREEIVSTARRILEVDRHPTATFESSRIESVQDGGTLSGTIFGTLTIRGTSAPVELRGRETRPDVFQGSAEIVQSAYGIKPYSAFLGALRLRDVVEVEFEVNLATAERI
jgi:polyisoprenoid-binding protein YceI